MTKAPQPVSTETPLDQAWAKVRAAFAGFIGNPDAVHAVQRGLVAALVDARPGQPVVMAKTLLFTGPASVGKTHLANLVTSVLAVPLVRLDGRGLRNRDRLFDLIDDALDAHDLRPQPSDPRSGVPTWIYPSIAVFVDEVHLVGAGTQESLLTMLEQDDRSVLLDGKRGRRIALVANATFIFATTRPAEMDRALRTRCTEIALQRYTEDEVALMVKQRFPQLPDTAAYSAVATIAACARFVPRVAFEMARDVLEEVKTSATPDVKAAVRRVMHGRSIIYANGITKSDFAYLSLLRREGRPLGEQAIRAQLQDLEAAHITDDIEPFLFMLRFVTVTPKGRQLTLAGERFLQEARAIQDRGG